MSGGTSERQRWMAVLSRASATELEAGLATLGAVPDYEIIKAPETGTVMVEARAGGAGRRFNAGEATVSRAVVRLADAQMGFSYVLGHDRRKALLAAILDAVLQDETRRDAVLRDVLTPLERAQGERRELASRKAAATKVDFFTLVRGD